MTLSLPHPGPKLKLSFAALLTSSILYLISFMFPISKGDIYFTRLNHWRNLVMSKNFTQADLLAKVLDSQDIAYFAKHHHPSFLTITIKEILKKPNRSTDDLIEVSLLYYQMADLENSRDFLLQAKQLDPIRSDIDTLLHQLSN